MYHNILTQKDYPEYSQIKKIVKLLLEFIEVDTIYFSKHFEEPSNIGIITVIISKSSPHFYDDIYEYAWKLFKSHPEFSFVIFDKASVKEELNEGNPFFIMNCSESELIYSTTTPKSIVNIEKINAKKLIEKTKKRFQIHTSYSLIIDRDLRFYRSHNFLMAAYNIHQQFRYLFISVSSFLTGEYRIEQSLKRQQENLRMFSSLLGNAFDPDKEEEWFVRKQLDKACSAIQWNKEIEPISKETVELASIKLDWFKKEIGRFFQEYLKKTKEIFEDHGNK
ncbi:hypothetical protein [Flavobacterium sp. XS2P39]|uniref:hypothetical protein n=1 Tax=Flavobacterium sp. XS2P39 TaxID=3401725 RepID=UPI003AAC627F